MTAHSEKEQAAPTFKKGYGFHPMWSFVDHGTDTTGETGTGEPLAFLLRKGNAGSNTATDHITIVRDALRQLPSHRSGTRPGRRVLIRTDGAGGTHEFLSWLTGQRLSYSVGLHPAHRLRAHTAARSPTAPGRRPTTATAQIRDGAFVAEVTGMLDLIGWPAGMRVIIRKERPHPGAQLRITDVDGNRVTAFATNTRPGGQDGPSQLADLELRHRRRARAEDRIRNAKDTGLTNLPLHDFNQNRIWCAVVALAVRTHRLDATPRAPRPSSPPVGTETAAAAAVLHRRPASPAPAGGSCSTSAVTPPGPSWPSTGSPDSAPSPSPADPRKVLSRRPQARASGRGSRRHSQRQRATCHTHPAQSPTSKRHDASQPIKDVS